MTETGVQPSAKSMILEDLVNLAWKGTIRVPHFQRDFRWASKDVMNLFDSIARGYPIGTLLFWLRDSPPATVQLGRLRTKVEHQATAMWVVDGQQRITSIANALHRDGHKHKPFDVYYDLANRTFLSTPRKLEAQHIPLPILFDLDELILWFSREDTGNPEYFKAAREIARKLREYVVPTYQIEHGDQSELIEIFDRLNNYGKRLTRAEIFSALFAPAELATGHGSELARIAESVSLQTKFGTIDEDTILQCVLARRGHDIHRDPHGEFDEERTRAGEFPSDDITTAHREAEKALVLAIEFLQQDAQVPHYTFLSYRALLVVLTRFFAHFPAPDPRVRELLRRFYWRASVRGVAAFSGSFSQFGRSLARRIKPGNQVGSVEKLLEAVGSERTELDIEKYKASSAATKIMLCSWWDLGPRSPLTGEPYTQESLFETLPEAPTASGILQPVFNSSQASVEKRAWSANRVLNLGDPADTLIEGLSRPRVGMSKEKWEEILRSHCMSRETASYLEWDKAEEFLEGRRRLVNDAFNAFVDRRAEWERDDVPPRQSLILRDAS